MKSGSYLSKGSLAIKHLLRWGPTMSFCLWTYFAMGVVGSGPPAAIEPENQQFTAVEKRRLPDKGIVSRFACSANGEWVATSSSGKGTINLWQFPSGKEVSTILIQGSVIQMAFSADGKSLLASVSKPIEGVAVRAFAIPSGKEAFSIPGVGGPIAVHPDGFFTVGARLGTIQFRKGPRRILQEFRETELTVYAAFSRNGKFLALSGLSKNVPIHDGVTGEPKFTVKSAIRPNAIVFSPDSNTLAIGGFDVIEFWDLKTGTLRSKIDVPCSKMAFSPNGKWLAVIAPVDKSDKSAISIRDVSTGKEVCSIPVNDWPKGIAFPRDDLLIHAGRRIVRVFEFTVKKK
jgi:WD40 repeat protein